MALLVAYRDFALSNSRVPLIEGLRDAGYRVIVAATLEGHQSDLESAGAKVEPLPFRRGGLAVRGDGRALARFVRILRRHRPALVHVFNGKPVLLGNAAALCLPACRVVSTITGLGYDPGAGSLMARALGTGYWLAGRRSSAMIFQNRDDLHQFVDSGRVPSNKVHLIVSSGVDTRRFNRSRPGRSGTDDGVTVLMVARLTRQKGVEEFLEAAGRVRQEYPKVEFVLGGEWSSHPDSVGREIVDRAVDRGDVRFVGYVDDMPRRLRSADVFVFPSYYREGVPRVLLEAGACGLPIVAADMPGCREVVRDGETGFLVPPREPEALTAAIVHLVRDAALRERMGQAGRRMVQADFDLQTITRKQLEVYREIGALPT